MPIIRAYTRLTEWDRNALSIEQVNPQVSEFFGGGRAPLYDAICVDADRGVVYFIDQDQQGGTLLRYKTKHAKLDLLAEIGPNDYFERIIRTSRNGRIFASSSLGVEILETNGQYLFDLRTPEFNRYDDLIAVSDRQLVILKGGGLYVYDHIGTLQTTLREFSVSGRCYSFAVDSTADNWNVHGLWFDRFDRLWVAGNGLVCIEEGRPTMLVIDPFLPRAPEASFIGVDSKEVFWYEFPDRYEGFQISEEFKSSLSPSLRATADQTGLEPALGANP